MICFEFCKFGQQEEIKESGATFFVEHHNQHGEEEEPLPSAAAAAAAVETDDFFDCDKLSSTVDKNKDLLNKSIDSDAPTIDTISTTGTHEHQQQQQQQRQKEQQQSQQQQQSQPERPPRFIYDSSLPKDWVNFGSPLYKVKKMTKEEKLVREENYNEEARKLILQYEKQREERRRLEEWDFTNFLLSLLGVGINLTVSIFKNKGGK